MFHMASFQSHIALALECIALVSGVLLFNKAAQEGFFCKKTGKTFGGLVIIIALLSIACTLFLTVKNYRAKDMGGMMRHSPMMQMQGMPNMPLPPKGDGK